jgi:hypothetical protein
MIRTWSAPPIIQRDLEGVRGRIKTQGYFKSQRGINLLGCGIITQIRVNRKVMLRGKEKQQSGCMPKFPSPFPKKPQIKVPIFLDTTLAFQILTSPGEKVILM